MRLRRRRQHRRNAAPGRREQRRRHDRTAADRDVRRWRRGRIGERHGRGGDRRPLDGDRHDRPLPDHELRGRRRVAGAAHQRHRLGVPVGRDGHRRAGRPAGGGARRRGRARSGTTSNGYVYWTCRPERRQAPYADGQRGRPAVLELQQRLGRTRPCRPRSAARSPSRCSRSRRTCRPIGRPRTIAAAPSRTKPIDPPCTRRDHAAPGRRADRRRGRGRARAT